jgi:indole-3-glycerol phosphate synthase
VSITETKSGTVLTRIIESRRAEVARRKRIMPEPVLRIAAGKAGAPRDFAGALARDQVNVIAEIKKASPSAGVLRRDFEPAALARGFERAGAAALSVLTEEENFQGALAHLRDASAAVGLPVLRKDFIVDTWQVWEARAANADSFLLIVAALDDAALTALLNLGRELGMEPLVEVHTADELERVLAAGAHIVGVNNRNLHTLEVRVETSLELVEMIPQDCITVSESGLRSAEDLRKLRAAGFDAFLIGESLMREAEPGGALQRLIDGISQRSGDSGAGSSDRSR